MAETIGSAVAVLMLLLGSVVMFVSLRSLLHPGESEESGAREQSEPADEGHPVGRLAA